jgi:hypothetical protein
LLSDRQTDRYTEKQIDTQKNKQKEKLAERQGKYSLMDRQIKMKMHESIERQTDIDKQTDKLIDKQTKR